MPTSLHVVSGPSWGLVLVRIVTGALLVSAGITKLAHGVGEELVLSTRPQIEAAPALYRWFAEAVVLSQPALVAKCIVWGEVLGGLALFLGALTRPAGVAIAFLMLNFLIAGPPEAVSTQALFLACALGCAISRAGRSAGADVFLDERLPAWATWTRAGG